MPPSSTDTDFSGSGCWAGPRKTDPSAIAKALSWHGR
jgi:hypothetical protein